mgnify:CR=1 FL=1
MLEKQKCLRICENIILLSLTPSNFSATTKSWDLSNSNLLTIIFDRDGDEKKPKKAFELLKAAMVMKRDSKNFLICKVFSIF